VDGPGSGRCATEHEAGSAPEAGPAPEVLASLERRLRSVPEPAMRRELALEALESRSPEEGYAVLAAALHQPEGRAPWLPILQRSLEEVLLDGGATRPATYRLRAGLYAEAARRGDESVMRLLRSAETARSLAEPGSALSPSLAEVPLGVRRSLARGADPHLLERLLRDADPVVIRRLLANPRLTEDQVVRIAARRPVAAATLIEVFRSPRFGRRLRVRLALARNPYCPTEIAVRSLRGLPAGSLREIARDATLHAQVREHAAAERARREAAEG